MDAKDVFPIRLKSEWDKSRLKGREFASKIGVSERTLFAWLNPNDERSPKRERLLAISRILGCSVDWLMGLSDVRTPDTAELKIEDEATRELMIEVANTLAEMEKRGIISGDEARQEVFRSILDNLRYRIYKHDIEKK